MIRPSSERQGLVILALISAASCVGVMGCADSQVTTVDLEENADAGGDADAYWSRRGQRRRRRCVHG